MELFEIIRKSYFLEKNSIRGIARTLKIHRRQVRQAIEDAKPPERKTTIRPSIVLTPQIKKVIQIWLDADQFAPPKQRHTSGRIYERLVSEHQFTGARSTVRRYISQVRKSPVSDIFVPQIHLAGEEAEVDWYEATVNFPSGASKVQVFQMRACYSGKEFHMAFEKQTQQAFLEGHVKAFEYFGGVFKKIRYDNLSSAVKKVLRGRKREQTERFIMLRSHYLFESVFCLPGKQGAHEKGGVEGGVGRFRRAHFVPVPTMKTLEALNKHLLASCLKDEQRTISGKDDSVYIRFKVEETKLTPLPKVSFTTYEILTAQVNSKSLVCVKNNFYSVPTEYVGQLLNVHVNAQKIEFIKQGKSIAIHTRCYKKHKIIAILSHYLALLKKKPGALAGSVALSQAKARGAWPPLYDQYWHALLDKFDQSSADQQFVDFLWWSRDYQASDLDKVLNQAINCGCLRLDMIKTFMRAHRQAPCSPPLLKTSEVENLIGFYRPQSSFQHYDDLLKIETAL